MSSVVMSVGDIHKAFAPITSTLSFCCFMFGIHSKIVTVSQVSVKARDSISIPCLYEPGDIKDVKYLCKVKTWGLCLKTVTTKEPDDSGKFSISDDPKQRIFTVTINDLSDEDISYSCAVEKRFLDVKKRFELSVTAGVPSLYVDQQEITAFEGGSVTVRCFFKRRKVTKWCKLNNGCVEGPTGSIDETTVKIDTSVANVFTVTMSGLRPESNGWYLCYKKDFQMPVHITVLQLTPTTTTMTPSTASTSNTATTITANTANITRTLPVTTQHSSPLTSAEPHTAQPTDSTINRTAGENLQDKNKDSDLVIVLTTTLSLLLLIVPAAFFGLKMMNKCNKRNPERSDITAGLHTGSDPDVHYATIVHNQHVAAQQRNDIPEDSVTYCTVIKDSMQVKQMIEPVDGSLSNSTLHTKTD
ncbi:uncharacterized protein LOC121955056 isoform X2 [Plectropomus leopardus]|uniref:uncharacterized protein LOC121955056 isoform X2 n=1 Tax=Plectropomus leopardus TaxID=160734 RepID=UPI001C4C9348|nr:uncharacterized protein LOC121955056 isoform X2 [Plectropomus leopardus]